MVGLGTQDDLDLAEDFVAATGTVSFPMLWDPSFESWQHYGITGQPAGLLLDPDGVLVRQWTGVLPEPELVTYAASLP